MIDNYDDDLAQRLSDFFATRRRTPTHFNVRPRYTPGSPAMVPEDIAVRVAVQERSFYERAISGRHGERTAEKARSRGLGGIVDVRRELPRGKGWDVLDLCTLERRDVPFKKNGEAD